MNLTLYRKWFTDISTTGVLFIDDAFFCTLKSIDARSGDNRKPDDLNRYYLFCPACDVAYNVRLRQNLPHEQICLFCPIVVWRDGARKQEKMHKDQFTMCEFGKFPYYRDWSKADSTQARRFAAAKIAKMRWEWIPEYENIYKEQEEQPWPISKQ